MFVSKVLKSGQNLIVTDNLNDVKNYLKNTYNEEDCRYHSDILFFRDDAPNSTYFQGKPIINWKKGKPYQYNYPSILLIW